MFKREPKEKPIIGLVIEPSTLKRYDMGLIDKMKADVKHGDYTLTPNAKRVFNERGFFGGIKQRYLLFDATNPEPDTTTLKPIGLEAFDPTVAVSAEEADLDIHETVTAGATANIIPRIKGAVAGKKWMIVMMIIVIIVAAIAFVLHSKGVF
jgi:hypothetical protein